MKTYRIYPVLAYAILALSVAGCGSSSSDSGGGGGAGTGTGTEAEALAVQQTAFSTLSVVLAQAFGAGGALRIDVDSLQNQVTVEETASCVTGSVPSPTGTLFSGTVTDTSGGSCEILIDGTASSFEVLLDCDEFLPTASGTTTIDGQEGFTFDEVGLITTVTWGSNGLSMNIDGTQCDVELNFVGTQDDGAGTTSLLGCITVCGTGFTIEGTI